MSMTVTQFRSDYDIEQSAFVIPQKSFSSAGLPRVR